MDQLWEVLLMNTHTIRRVNGVKQGFRASSRITSFASRSYHNYRMRRPGDKHTWVNLGLDKSLFL